MVTQEPGISLQTKTPLSSAIVLEVEQVFLL